MRVCSCHRLVRLLFSPNAIVWLPASAFQAARERTCRLERRRHSTGHCSAAHVAEAEERREQHKEANACKQTCTMAPTRTKTCVGKKRDSGNAMRCERLLNAPQPTLLRHCQANAPCPSLSFCEERDCGLVARVSQHATVEGERGHRLSPLSSFCCVPSFSPLSLIGQAAPHRRCFSLTR